MAETKLWGGRFSGDVDPLMEAFNSSIKFDCRLWKEDLNGSLAYAKSLLNAGLIDSDERDLIISGLEKIKDEWEQNKFRLEPHDEDIHSANERRLKELIGPIGGKLHTGRSRNDQVATDTRLWCKDWLNRFTDALRLCLRVIVDRAEGEKHILMPGYTHLQQAQPIRWSHLLLSYASALRKDYDRFKDCIKRVDICPLGSGALAGNPFNVNRLDIARDLGFAEISTNSIEAVSSRDYIVELESCAAMCAVNLSRMSEDLIIYSCKEFSFIQLSDAYSTGSSLMPQKKNADSLELIRGKAGRVTGQLMGFLTTLKGTPSSFNKDFQEDKESLFDVCDTIMAMVQIMTGVLATLTINEDKCLSMLNTEMLSTDLAYYLVRKGMPFREAHGLSGQCVVLAEQSGCPLDQLSLAQFQSISGLFDKTVLSIWDYSTSVEQYQVFGGTSMSSVKQQINLLRDWLQ